VQATRTAPRAAGGWSWPAPAPAHASDESSSSSIAASASGATGKRPRAASERARNAAATPGDEQVAAPESGSLRSLLVCALWGGRYAAAGRRTGDEEDEGGEECDSGGIESLARTLRSRPELLRLLVSCEQQLSGAADAAAARKRQRLADASAYAYAYAWAHQAQQPWPAMQWLAR
jgi:hypothetical protein